MLCWNLFQSSMSKDSCDRRSSFLFHFNIMRKSIASKWKHKWSPKRHHYMGRSEVSTSVVKWSEGLSNRMSIVITRYTDQMLIWLFRLPHVFIILLVLFCITIWLYVLYTSVNFVNYVFLLLRIILCSRIHIVMYVLFWVFCFIVLFCVLFVCKCVLHYCHWVSTQLQLITSFF